MVCGTASNLSSKRLRMTDQHPVRKVWSCIDTGSIEKIFTGHFPLSLRAAVNTCLIAIFNV